MESFIFKTCQIPESVKNYFIQIRTNISGGLGVIEAWEIANGGAELWKLSGFCASWVNVSAQATAAQPTGVCPAGLPSNSTEFGLSHHGVGTMFMAPGGCWLPSLGVRPEILRMALGFPCMTNSRSCHIGIPLELG